ncbi:MAG: hypothetical protein AAGA90_10205 [Actinomycetota bacterium]
MARRLDIELTSDRGDGSWTWRAAGAKQPKGTLDGALLPSGAAVGDVLKVEADADLDGLTITTVFAPKGPRKEAETLQLLGSGRDEPLVTQVLAPKGRGRGRDGDDRGRGRGRGRGRDGDDRGRGRGRGGRDGDNRGRDRNRNDRPRRERPKPPARPKAPRLRPGRTHRQAALKALPAIQHPLAEEVFKGGVPGVRQAIDRMNDKASAEGMPKIKREPLIALAEKLAPTLKAAEWRDRAEAAVAGIESVDLRDIRSVVAAADSAARDEETRALADQLRDGLSNRTEAEHRAWRDELAQTIAEGRTVRALRLSSRPPKAGAPLPVDMAEKLAAAASESLTSEVTSDRWATVVDAVAFSPVRTQVSAQGIPANPSDELTKTMRKLAGRVPQLAALYGIEAPADGGRGRGKGKGKGKGRPTPPPPPPAPAPVTDAAPSEAEPAPAAEAAATPPPEPTPVPEATTVAAPDAAPAPDPELTETAAAPEPVPEAAAAPEPAPEAAPAETVASDEEE